MTALFPEDGDHSPVSERGDDELFLDDRRKFFHDEGRFHGTEEVRENHFRDRVCADFQQGDALLHSKFLDDPGSVGVGHAARDDSRFPGSGPGEEVRSQEKVLRQ